MMHAHGIVSTYHCEVDDVMMHAHGIVSTYHCEVVHARRVCGINSRGYCSKCTIKVGLSRPAFHTASVERLVPRSLQACFSYCKRGEARTQVSPGLLFILQAWRGSYPGLSRLAFHTASVERLVPRSLQACFLYCKRGEARTQVSPGLLFILQAWRGSYPGLSRLAFHTASVERLVPRSLQACFSYCKRGEARTQVSPGLLFILQAWRGSYPGLSRLAFHTASVERLVPRSLQACFSYCKRGEARTQVSPGLLFILQAWRGSYPGLSRLAFHTASVERLVPRSLQACFSYCKPGEARTQVSPGLLFILQAWRGSYPGLSRLAFHTASVERLVPRSLQACFSYCKRGEARTQVSPGLLFILQAWRGSYPGLSRLAFHTASVERLVPRSLQACFSYCKRGEARTQVSPGLLFILQAWRGSYPGLSRLAFHTASVERLVPRSLQACFSYCKPGEARTQVSPGLLFILQAWRGSYPGLSRLAFHTASVERLVPRSLQACFSYCKHGEARTQVSPGLLFILQAWRGSYPGLSRLAFHTGYEERLVPRSLQACFSYWI